MLFSYLEPIADPVILFSVPSCSAPPRSNSAHSSIYFLYFAVVLVLSRLNFQQHGKCFKNLFSFIKKNQKLSVPSKRKMIRKCLWKLPSF